MEAPNIVKVSAKIPLEEYDKERLAFFYETMLKIRKFERTVEEKFLAGEIPGFVHLYIGEEAVATGVMANLTHKDYIESTHRGHGHTIAKGADLKPMMAEIYGKKTGCCKGKGGSMHIADFSVGMLGANGVVGGGYNLAAGAALAQKMQGRKDVSVVFFGDGASNRGTFHEAANMASVWKLPLLFVCEMNEYASTTPYLTATSVADISRRAYGYDMPAAIVNGNDVFSVYEAAKQLIEYIRAGNGPAFLECKTYRVKGHFVGDPEKYRTRDEVQKNVAERDPIEFFEKKILDAGLYTQSDMEAVQAKVDTMIAGALKFAQESPEPDASELLADLYV
ncbi:MAG: thiamine pyrophosphate-dependent dehydrogenase E1 component subunit alpha [Defluviitaleaceae bacterium]|nr:thiamine pyrophosphate-dependent dehydrogenase E1 component subunit alpha [Defluviitaleaceae bacterium]